VKTGKTRRIGSLCYPCANSSSCSFNNRYVFKFGGVHNLL
jgi:hypothetical protein